MSKGENLRDRQQDTSAGAESSQQVAGNGKSTNAGSTKGGSSRDDALQLLVMLCSR